MRGAALLVLLVAAGCASPAPALCSAASLRARSTQAWDELATGELRPAQRGWPIETPDPGANVTDLRWRPDGGSPLADDATSEQIGPEGRVAVVLYELTWWPLEGRGDADMPWLQATYSTPIDPEQVRADLGRFMDRVGGPTDRDGFMDAFLASSVDQRFGGGVTVVDGRRHEDDGRVVAQRFGARWTGPGLSGPLAQAFWAQGWDQRTAVDGDLAAFVDLPARSHHVVVDNATFRFRVDSSLAIDGQADAPGTEVEWEALAERAFAQTGVQATGLSVQATSSHCVDGS